MKTTLETGRVLLLSLLGVVACTDPTRTLTPARLLADRAAPARRQYTATDIGTLGGATAQASAINSAGLVVGSAQTAGGKTHAFLWSARGGMKDLGDLGGGTSTASAINNQGHVVGLSSVASGPDHAFLWTAAGGMVDLGTIGGPTSSATGINDRDQVVGTSVLIAGGAQHAFLWSSAGRMTDLGTFGGQVNSIAINNRQQVVGWLITEGCPVAIAFLWSAHDGLQNLGDLSNSALNPCGGAGANAINESGEVVGLGTTSTYLTHAFLWTSAAGMVDLGTLTGANGYSVAWAINQPGDVAGDAAVSSSTPFPLHAVVWNAGGSIQDLGTLPSDVSSFAKGINDRGDVVGYSRGSGGTHAVLWTSR